MIFLIINQTSSFSTAHSVSWTAQNWLDCTVRICADGRSGATSHCGKNLAAESQRGRGIRNTSHGRNSRKSKPLIFTSEKIRLSRRAVAFLRSVCRRLGTNQILRLCALIAIFTELSLTPRLICSLLLLNNRRWEGRSFCVQQRVSVLVQRYNAVLSHYTWPDSDCTDWWSVPNCVLF